MAESAKAVFLSYASQDAEAAKRIAEALRAAGVEVWFDQSELRGGDAWDAKIRKQIKECALFVPIISPNTNSRPEGYFRLEWKLAVDRSHLLADDHPFLFPVVTGDVADATARVPDKFRDVQWTRLRLDETPSELAARIARLLAGDIDVGRGRRTPPSVAGAAFGDAALQRRRGRPVWLRYAWAVAGLVIALSYALRPYLSPSRHREEGPAPVSLRPSPSAAATPTNAPETEARQLVARARTITKGGSLTREQLDAASELCDRALRLDPTDPTVWAGAARTDLLLIYPYGYDQSDARRKQALSRVTRARNLAPDSLEVRLLYAQVIAHAGATPALLQEAEKTLRELHASHPDDHKVVSQLAEVLRQGERYEEAARLFESIDDYEVAAWSYYQAGAGEGALAMVDRALTTGRSVTALQLRAILLLDFREDPDAAQRVIEQLRPSELLNEMPAAGAAQVYLFQRNPDRVKQVMQTLPTDYLDSNAFRGPRQYYTGFAEAIAGRAGPAESEWRAGLKVVENRMQADPDNRRLLLWAAWLQASLGNRPEAERLLARAQQVAGFDPARIVDKESAGVWLRLGRDDAVLDWLEQTLRARPRLWERTHAEARFEPAYDRLRGNARFEKLLRDHLPPGAKPFADQKPETGGQGSDGGDQRSAFSTLSGPSAAPPPLDFASAKSIAVLAFANLSDDKANEYFSDGISEELLNVLAKIPGLKVSARTSAFYFKGKQVPMTEIARQLGVAYVVEGSVRKAGDRVRITAQLIKAADGFHVWSDTFTRDLKDIFAVQDEIAGLIAQNLQLKLGEAARGARVVNPEAHQLYLQGKYFLNQFSLDNAIRAAGLLQRAVELDPEFAPAWAELSRAGRVRSGYGNTRQDFDEGYALARRAADRALLLDPELARAHLALSEVQSGHDFDWQGAAASLRRAQALAPADADVLDGVARLAYAFGRKNAVDLGRQAVALDPANPAVRISYGFALNSQRRYEEAEAEFRRVIELNPTAPWGHAGVSINHTTQGRYDEAAIEAGLETNEWSRLFALALAQWGQKKPPEADATLNQLIKTYADVAAYQIAEVHAFRRDNDRAFEWLERAYRQRDPGLAWSKPDPFLDNLHADPRWEAFMRKLGLADDQLK